MPVAICRSVDDAKVCRLGLAVVSALHWVAIMIYMEPFGPREYAGEYTRVLRRLADLLMDYAARS